MPSVWTYAMTAKPYYEAGGITIFHGDNAEVMPTLSDIDLIFTSPPYNLGASPWPHLGNWKPGDSPSGKSKWRNGSDGVGGITYTEHEDTIPWAEYVAWQRNVLTACWSALGPAGAIFYNHKTRVIGGRLWRPDELLPEHLTLRQEVIWARAGGMNFNPTAYVPTHERIYILAKPAWRLRDKSASGIGDVWRVPQEANPDHPAPFPIGLPARAIESVAPSLVCDPFMGSGTTLRAAKDAGIRAIGIEKSERYCEIAARRLAQGSLFGASA